MATSGEEQAQTKKINPGTEEAPAPLPVPAGRKVFAIHPKCLRAKIERDRLAAESGLIHPLPHPDKRQFSQLVSRKCCWFVYSFSNIVHILSLHIYPQFDAYSQATVSPSELCTYSQFDAYSKRFSYYCWFCKFSYRVMMFQLSFNNGTRISV